MKSQNTKSSDELKLEVDKELRNVRRDINDIQGRLTPGQFIDDAIFHGGSPAATFDHLKRNPVGTTFLSLGTLLLMEDENHSTYETNAKSKISSARATANAKMSSLKEEIKSRIPSKDAIQAKISSVREGIEAKIPTESEIRETFLQGEESNAEGFAGMESSKAGKLQAAREKLSTGLSHGREKLSAGLETGKEKFKNMDNTTFMALGAGLGVLTGSSLPISDAEERLVGEKFQGRLSDFNHDLREAMNECSNILKDLVISDVKNLNVKIF